MRVLATALGIVGLIVVGSTWVTGSLNKASTEPTPQASVAATQGPAAGNVSSGSPPLNLGGGYRAAKWGMSAVQVARAIGKPEFWSVEDLTYRDGGTTEEFRVIIGDNEQQLYWRFYRDCLYEVEIYPFMKGEDTDGTVFRLIISKLQEKFGRWQSVRPRDPSYTKFVEWNDGETRVDCLKWGVGSELETITILYTSQKIERQIKLDRKATREQAQRKENARVQAAIDKL